MNIWKINVTERITMYNEQADYINLKTIAECWKKKCLDHSETLDRIADLVNGGESNENLLNCLRDILKKANFIKS